MVLCPFRFRVQRVPAYTIKLHIPSWDPAPKTLELEAQNIQGIVEAMYGEAGNCSGFATFAIDGYRSMTCGELYHFLRRRTLTLRGDRSFSNASIN